MKRTFKIAAIGIAAASVIAAATVLGCQAGLDANNQTAEQETEEDRAAKKKQEDMTDSEKIDELYSIATKKKPFQYKGQAIAITRLSKMITKEFIDTDSIEDPVAKYFAEVGLRTLDAGVQFLDHVIDDATGGLYGVVVNIFWPKGDEPSKDTKMILDKIDEVEDQIAGLSDDMNKNFKDLKDTVISENDKNLIKERNKMMNELKNAFIEDGSITAAMQQADINGLTFSEYQVLLAAITGRTDFKGSVTDISAAVKNFFDDYTIGSQKGGETYTEVYDRYAKSLSAWGFEYDEIMNSFAEQELLRTAQLMSVMEAAFDPYSGSEINYNYHLQNLLSYLKTNGSSLAQTVADLINGLIPAEKYGDFTFEFNGETVTPDIIAASKNDSEKLYFYVLAYLCKKTNYFPENYAEVEMNGGTANEITGYDKQNNQITPEGVKISNLCTYLHTISAGVQQWEDLEAKQDAYVNNVNKIFDRLVNDKLGYVTCMIPGVNRTFLTTMGTVHYGDRLYTFCSLNWSDWVNGAFHGQDILGDYDNLIDYYNENVRSELTSQYSDKVYSSEDYYNITNAEQFYYLTEDEYKAIYEWYHNGKHALTSGVPVTYADKKGKVVAVERTEGSSISNPTLTQIFFYGAGIGFSVKIEDATVNGASVKAFIPCEEAEVDLGISKTKWDTGLYPRPKDDKNLFDVAVSYIYEGGIEAVVADEHNDITAPFTKWSGNWEYRIEGKSVRGDKNGDWGDKFKCTNWILCNLCDEKGYSVGSGYATAQSIIYNVWGNYRKDVDLRSDQTYVFPSCLNNTDGKTYWEKMNDLGITN